MLKLNGTAIEDVKFNGVDLDKVIVNGVIVFEKTHPQENIVTMKTLRDNISLLVETKDRSPCEVWNAENKIGVLNNGQKPSISIPNKNEAVIIKGKDITSLSCDSNQLTSLDVQGLNNLQHLYCCNNQLTSLDVQNLNNLQYLFCSSNHLTSLDVQGLNNLQYLNFSWNRLTSLDVQGLNNLQHLNCYWNQLAAQAFREIFNSLLRTENGTALVYNDYDDNYKDFSRPPALVEAFNGAKARGWTFYKNYVGDSNLL